jgi:hypothetical protein
MSMPLTPTVDPGHHHFETGDIYFYMNTETSAFVAGSPGYRSNYSNPSFRQPERAALKHSNSVEPASSAPLV